MKAGRRNCSSFSIIVITFAILAVTGVVFMANLIPTSEANAKAIEGPKTVKDKLLDWIPNSHSQNVFDNEDLPDWSKEFWTPIDVEISSDPMVTLCKLNFKKYWENPHIYPMYKDLVSLSKCLGTNRKRERMSVLLKELETTNANIVKPSGFVFHESRVGSTLIANFLASDPYSLVFSESTPMANALLHCPGCSDEEQVKMFRNVATLMGNSPIHKRLFFKFQSITSTKLERALLAYPDTAWAFVFREPVQTMMSHLDPKKGTSAAPCLRSKRNPPAQVSDVIKGKVPHGSKVPNEAWCAAHLNMLCTFALDAYNRYGKRVTSTGDTAQRGLLINYESLPGAVPRTLLPLFGIEVNQRWLTKMQSESQQYSKSRGGGFRLWFGDSKDKTERATDEIEKYAKSILGESFNKLNEMALDAYTFRFPHLLTLDVGATTFEWKSLSKIPESVRSLAALNSENDVSLDPPPLHSSVLAEKEFKPYLPFANHHSSVTFQVPNCPLLPPTGYPTTYALPKIISNWKIDSADIPVNHFDTLCHFDYLNATQLQQAYAYRKAEVPFVVFNIPELDGVVKKWNDFEYLSDLLGHKRYRTETSKTNHFMYWKTSSSDFKNSQAGKDWTSPTTVSNVKFQDWLEIAVKGQNKTLEDRTHQYFRVSSTAGNDWLFDELPFFKPTESLMVVDPIEQKGIHCRFGMKSMIAEAHFDGSRNSVAMVGGLRRWILAHPNQCGNMNLLPNDHPSGRHSSVDWSAPDLKKYPDFNKIVGNEVILQPGDFLYVPTNWIHYVVSLNVNFQCNSRSGRSSKYDEFIRNCGF